MRLPIFLLASLLLASCAAGPTPERSGFDYPEAGLSFRPRRHVTSDTSRGNISESENAGYSLIFPRTTSQIENPNVRLLTTGIAGEWNENPRPLFDEISEYLYGAEVKNEFQLTEEREIEVPWPGVTNGTGIFRVFAMTPKAGGETSYSFTVLIHHYGNTIEFCWRDGSGIPPDDEKLEIFFYWTHGMRFFEPEESE